MEKRSYRDLFEISGMWLGVYLEIFLKTRGLPGNLGTTTRLQRKPGASLQIS
jgi:hypothetical protein